MTVGALQLAKLCASLERDAAAGAACNESDAQATALAQEHARVLRALSALIEPAEEAHG